MCSSDLPHHENEIAQSEAAGYGFAQLWMHNAWVTTAGEKMSKSLGNSLQVKEILKKVRGAELRWYLGSAHYRSMLEFSFEALEESAVAYRRIEKFLKRAGIQEPIIDAKFADLMNDDLAVPQALALVSEWLTQGNTALTQGKSADVANAAAKIRGVLTVLGCDPFDAAFAADDNSELTQAIDGLISLLLEQREAARSRKDFAAADAIRDRISGMGITIEDTPEGPRWSI